MLTFISRLLLTFVLCLFAMQAIATEINSQTKQALVNAAKTAQKNTHSPYSKFPVGAALLTQDNKIILGTNVENASYGLTSCAERNAIFSAVSQGHKTFKAVAVITKTGGSPCGACRQVLNEFNPDMLIIIANQDGRIIQETSLQDLLPDSFGPKNLG